MKSVIYIHEFLPSVIATRKSVSVLKNELDKIKEGNTISLDFTNIVLVSRSFANEIVQLCKNSLKKIELVNFNSNISLIIKAVENTIVGKQKSYDNIPVTSFSNKSELFDFLATV